MAYAPPRLSNTNTTWPREGDIKSSGVVVRLDNGDDSVVEIRMGSGIFLINITNRRSELLVKSIISFSAPEIQLYSYDL